MVGEGKRKLMPPDPPPPPPLPVSTALLIIIRSWTSLLVCDLFVRIDLREIPNPAGPFI